MDFINNIPIEILEEIFLYLNTDDLIKCSYVSLKWREVVNTNKIWSAQCSKEKIQRKDNLQTSWSLIANPMKIFRDHDFNPDTRFSVSCHWRAHYNRYRFLERNWRKGNFSLIRIEIGVEHYRDGMLITLDNVGLGVYCLQDLKTPMFIKKTDTSQRVDAVTVKDGRLFYTQGHQLVCIARDNCNFHKLYEITVSNGSKHAAPRRAVLNVDQILALKITDKFMVIQDMTNACFLHFYDYKTGNFEREVNFHTFTGHRCQFITCLEAFDDKVFVAYSLVGKHYILIYDYTLDKVNVKLETSYRSSELVVSKNFFCSKLLHDDDMLEKSCDLSVWSVRKGEQVLVLCSNRHLPILLTTDDKLIYSENFTVFVRGLVDSSQDVQFTVEGRPHGMESIWSNLLVLNLGSSLQLWDLTSGQKLHTYFRETIEDMWVDDRHIVVRLANRRPWMTTAGFIIAFW